MSYNLIVIGSGPGGYVAAIRASQLGMKVAIVEKESLGGICLNWGCIPTKALLKSAQVFDYVNHSENYGIKISKSSVDFDSIISRSRGIADGMSKGVNFLMKKNKIDILNGFGKIISKNEVEVTTEENKKEIQVLIQSYLEINHQAIQENKKKEFQNQQNRFYQFSFLWAW